MRSARSWQAAYGVVPSSSLLSQVGYWRFVVMDESTVQGWPWRRRCSSFALAAAGRHRRALPLTPRRLRENSTDARRAGDAAVKIGNSAVLAAENVRAYSGLTPKSLGISVNRPHLANLEPSCRARWPCWQSNCNLSPAWAVGGRAGPGRGHQADFVQTPQVRPDIKTTATLVVAPVTGQAERALSSLG
jgi:hypothetical protein